MAPRDLAAGFLALLAATVWLPECHGAAGNAEVYRFKIGNISAMAINDGTFSLPDTVFFKGQGPEDLAAARQDAHRAPGDLLFYNNVLYLEWEDQRVLLDTGAGANFAGTGRLADNLAAAGVDLTKVDFVILSHARNDHYGGILAEDGSFVYPNAQYFVTAADADLWAADNARVWEAVQPRVTLVEADGEIIVPGIKAVFTPGYTPGHMALEVDGGEGSKLLFTGDATFNELTLSRPDWEVALSTDPALGVLSRQAMLKAASDEGTQLMTYHISFPGLGFVNAIDDGESYTWVPSLYEFSNAEV